jgi:hypothetical protein
LPHLFVWLAPISLGASAPHNVHVTARWPGWALILAGWLAWLATPVIGALVGHPTAALRSTPEVAAYLLTGTVLFAARPLSPVARRLLAYAALLAAGYVIGTGYSAYLVKESTPAWGWLVILAMQGIDFASFMLIFAACAVFPDGKYQRSYEQRMVAVLGAAVPLLLVMQLVCSARLKQVDFVWQNSVSARNPAAIPALAGLGAVSAVVIQGGVVALLLGVVVLILRYRRFGPAERQQIAWPLYALALTGCALAVQGSQAPLTEGFLTGCSTSSISPSCCSSPPGWSSASCGTGCSTSTWWCAGRSSTARSSRQPTRGWPPRSGSWLAAAYRWTWPSCSPSCSPWSRRQFAGASNGWPTGWCSAGGCPATS